MLKIDLWPKNIKETSWLREGKVSLGPGSARGLVCRVHSACPPTRSDRVAHHDFILYAVDGLQDPHGLVHPEHVLRSLLEHSVGGSVEGAVRLEADGVDTVSGQEVGEGADTLG